MWLSRPADRQHSNRSCVLPRRVRTIEDVTTRNLVSVDGGLALVLDAGVLQILDMDESTVVRLSTDGDCLVVTPIRAKGRRRRFEEALESAAVEYDAMLREMVE